MWASSRASACAALILVGIFIVLIQIEVQSRGGRGSWILGDIKTKSKVYDDSTSSDTITILPAHPPERTELMLEEATARFSRYQPTRGVAALRSMYGGLVLSASVDAAAGRVTAYPLTMPETCPDLTLWFRLAGPEILSGLLEQKGCMWSYEFPRPPAAGEYVAVVKVMSSYDGSDIQRSTCGFKEDVVYEGVNYRNYTTNSMFLSAAGGCCDMCTRDGLCTHFTARAGRGGGNLKCIFYSSVRTSDVVEGLKNKWRTGSEKQDFKVISGVKRTERATNMFACGWSYSAEDSPCLDLGRDDVLYMEDETVTFEDSGGDEDMKVCDVGSQLMSEGRWVHSPRSQLGCGGMTVRAPESHFFQIMHSATEAEEVRGVLAKTRVMLIGVLTSVAAVVALPSVGYTTTPKRSGKGAKTDAHEAPQPTTG